MKRLSSLVLRKWKDKERWMERRRSEPSARGEEEEDERKTDLGHRQTHRRLLRRRSEPCGRMEKDEKTEERRKSDWRKSDSITEEGDKMEKGRVSCIMLEDRVRGHEDRRQRDMDRKTMRRRSEPCGILYVQLLPLSCRKRRDLLQRRTGRSTSCSDDGDWRMDRRGGDRCPDHMSRGTSEPVGPLENSKINVVITIATTT
ncbi:hypothetical protein ILYODFUR_033560 [Ilyodon furcidens]|uniref:Uncharacterized protein n=1 Tax=Ilyodon furcidens TaxID=33524 RepID=A0ABV0UMZ8_9TELE